MKFFDLHAANEEARPALDAAYERVIDSGWVILGPELESFEAEFADYCGAQHCIGVANGLDALALGLRARDISAGDEVIVPSHTFVATWLAVAMAGARPVPVEVDPATFMIDPAGVEAAITSRTKAILPVSLYGHPIDAAPLKDIADRRGLFLLEDAAQSHGARHGGRRTGSTAHATTFSFYPTKNLGALGDGGAIVTDDDALAARLRLLRNYGSEEKYVHTEPGVNSRLDELQAAFLRARLPSLDRSNARRREIAAVYDRELAGIPGLITPTVAHGAEHVYHLYVVRCRMRDALAAGLKARGIATLIHYPIPPHRQGAFADLGFVEGAFPVAEALAHEVLSLPIWPQMDPASAVEVAAAIRQILSTEITACPT